AFAGERVPALAEVFALVKARGHPDTLVALDLKVEGIEADVVRLAKEHGVLSRVVCIGTAIDSAAVRRRLLAADPQTPVAVLAQRPAELPRALGDRTGSWAYLRFVPLPDEVMQARAAGKKVIVVGPTVAGEKPRNWQRAWHAGVGAVLTDFPLKFRSALR